MVTAPTTSPVFEVITEKKSFQIIITGNGVALLEASSDGVNFSILQPAVARSEVITDSFPFKFYRAGVLSITTGSVTVILGIST